MKPTNSHLVRLARSIGACLALASLGQAAWAMSSLPVERIHTAQWAQVCADTESVRDSSKNTPNPVALSGSTVALGTKDIATAWFAAPTNRYPHKSMGSIEHAGALVAKLNKASGGRQLQVTLPLDRVFEDLEPRLVDLDGDGRDEIIVIEAQLLRGSSMVVYGVRADGRALVELARSPATGLPFRWLNPAGVGDFDGDGRLDLSAVITPHVAGSLILYHYAPPNLVPFATQMDISNHRMGAKELRLSVVLPPEHSAAASGRPFGSPGPIQSRALILVPDMQRKLVYLLRWDHDMHLKELAATEPLPTTIERMSRSGRGACFQTLDGVWWRVDRPH